LGGTGPGDSFETTRSAQSSLDQPRAATDSMSVVFRDIPQGTKLCVPTAEPHTVTLLDTTKGRALKSVTIPALAGWASANSQQ